MVFPTKFMCACTLLGLLAVHPHTLWNALYSKESWVVCMNMVIICGSLLWWPSGVLYICVINRWIQSMLAHLCRLAIDVLIDFSLCILVGFLLVGGWFATMTWRIWYGYLFHFKICCYIDHDHQKWFSIAIVCLVAVESEFLCDWIYNFVHSLLDWQMIMFPLWLSSYIALYPVSNLLCTTLWLNIKWDIPMQSSSTVLQQRNVGTLSAGWHTVI